MFWEKGNKMSSNNFILIERHKKGWLIGMRDFDTGGLIGKRRVYKDLERACRVAQWEMDNINDVEYGINFRFEEEIK